MVAALERDIHVFCEKPLAPRLSGAETTAAARESDAAAATGFNYRYVPALRLARRMFDAVEFGDIRRFRGQYLQNWQADPEHEWVCATTRRLPGPGHSAIRDRIRSTSPDGSSAISSASRATSRRSLRSAPRPATTRRDR